MRYTAAHWGTYTITGEADDVGLAPLADDPQPSVIGRGWLGAVRDEATRIRRPSVRRAWLEKRDRNRTGRDGFVELPWDEALDLAAGELRRVIDAHGNRAIFGGSYGWASAGRFHHAQSQLRRFLNLIGGYTRSVDTYSHAAGEVLLPHVTGMSNALFQDRMTSWSLLEGNTELLLCFGGISGRTAQVMSSGTTGHEVEGWLARIHRAGARIVNISPRRADVPKELEAEWIAPRPNTDTALMMGLAHVLIEEGLVNRAFLDRYTHGWPRLEAYLTGAADGTAKSADWAAAITGVDAGRILALAREMAGRTTMISLAWGIQRADHGEQPLWMGLALAAMLGRIGSKGGGFGFGYGSTTPVGRPIRPLPWPSLPQGRNPVADRIPVARIADLLLEPGGNCAYNGETLVYPDIRLVYWTGGNPFHAHQDLNRLAEAWKRPETVIVNDIWWTPTARRADIVFPATSPLERRDVMLNRRDGSLVFMDRVLAPIGEARDDHAVFRGLAERFGVAEAFTEGLDEAGWLRRLWDEASTVAGHHGVELPAFDAFRAAGRFDRPDPSAEAIQFGAFVADPEGNPLATPSGRIELHSEVIAGFGLADCPGHPVWIEPAEWLGAKDAGDRLHLVSGQSITRLHGQMDNGPVARATKIDGREPVYLHPATARRLGVAAGDIVLLSNDRGRALAGVVVDEGIREDVAWMGTGAWYDPQEIDGELIDVHGNANTLTIDKGTSGLAQGNIAHTALVTVGKWEKSLPGLAIDRPPPIVPRHDGTP
ncbi:Biotin sulfoxide reductase [uncultured Pleomorphomonas sp.]|uniref:Biotin sulfoxide reductase n=1 Tax=uncultured Pleomorphomonas sp. TaxID=442121 RepID=A0A212LEL2_9HYPH|nr:molybdopterin-dependent oxidoreductase [uncultured Pleomorphomonas sp.]SCM76006.1 Biotin sulfoxide reductase [uncultured Pleomorphomonas sp.]